MKRSSFFAIKQIFCSTKDKYNFSIKKRISTLKYEGTIKKNLRAIKDKMTFKKVFHRVEFMAK